MSQPDQTQSVVFTLKTGEEIQIDLDEEGRLGEAGFRIRVISLSGRLVVQPRSDNRVDLLTLKSMVREEEAVRAVAEERRASKPVKR